MDLRSPLLALKMMPHRTAALALRRLGPVEDARQALQGTPSPQSLGHGGQCGHLQPKGPWRLSSASAMHRAFSNKRFKDHGLFFMETAAGA
jgi:hypothetical protein